MFMFTRNEFIESVYDTASMIFVQYMKEESRGAIDPDGRHWWVGLKPYDDVRYQLTQNDIERGIAHLISGSVEYSNPGYGENRKRWGLLSATNGHEGDFDAIDADAAIQAALFGEIRYG